jgi:hypothetical protein
MRRKLSINSALPFCKRHDQRMLRYCVSAIGGATKDRCPVIAGHTKD